MDFDLLKQLTEAPGVPGREERVREIIRGKAKPLFDEIRTDTMGNLICRRSADKSLPRSKGKASSSQGAQASGTRKILLACHIDEIGFYVRYVDDKGFLRLNAVGGFDTRNLHARKVLVQGREDLVGVLNPSGRPIHVATDEEKKKVYQVQEFYVDLHLPAKKVQKLVEVGDPVTLLATTEKVGHAVVGKAMDNRVSSYVALQAVRKLAEGKKAGSPYEIFYVATVQEEVGCRGAGPAVFGIQPDIAIALDTTLSCDTPGVPGEEQICAFGGGVAIKVMDGNSISDRALVDELQALARANKIPFQLELLPRGGTDAGPIQRSQTGYRTVTLSVPTRYVHTITESVHEDDLKAAVDLLSAYLAG